MPRLSPSAWFVRAAALVATAIALTALPVAPAGAAGGSATLSGKLTGAKLPAAGTGRVPLRAMRLRDGVTVASTNVPHNGRFSLVVPPGSYALLAAIVPRSGRRDAVARVADFVTAKAGKKIKIKPTMKKRKKKRHKRKHRRTRAADHRAKASFVDVPYPAVHVHRWTTQGSPEVKVMEKGMQDMVISDLSAELGQPDCPGVVVAGDDLPKVLGEIKLSQSKYFDSKTRMSTKNIINENAAVRGTLSVAGDTVTISATYTDQRTGRSGTVSVSGPGANLFDLETQLVKKLVNEVICEKLPKTYVGSISGTFTTDLNDLDVSWSGSATLDRDREHGPPPPNWPSGDYAHYVMRSGLVHAKLQGFRGVCSAGGETDITLPAGVFGGEVYVQVGVPQRNFNVAIFAPADAVIPYQETGFGCQTDPQYPLTAVPFANTPAPLTSSTFALSGNTSQDQFGFSHFTSAFNFSPAG